MFEKFIYWISSLVKRPFRVGIITPQYPFKGVSNQGVAIHSFYLSGELARLGCDVHVFSVGPKKSKKVEFIGKGRRILHRINISPEKFFKERTQKRKFSTFLFDNLILHEVLKENSEDRFDVIHSQISMTSALIMKYFSEVKWVHTFHSLERIRQKYVTKESKKYMGLTNWMQGSVTYPDAIISVSRSLKKEILEAYPDLKENRVLYIPNGVDTDKFKPDSSVTSDKRVLFVARFSLEKGIDLVSRIAKNLLKKDLETKVELVIPIDDYLSESMEKIKEDLEALEKQHPERVIWHKRSLSRDELAEAYNRCSVYIQPSRYESFGMTVLEAMACGKAVIVSDRGGLPELVDNAGIVLSPNTKLFVREIRRLLKDYRLRERYSRRALERSKLFKWDVVGKNALELYKLVTGSEKGVEKNEEIREAMEVLE